ncbi:MAG: hypothetical protein QXN08_04965, partial [Nitrososphaerales archaeon]
DKTIESKATGKIFFKGFSFSGFALNISPAKKRTAKVPAPTANWKTATNKALFKHTKKPLKQTRKPKKQQNTLLHQDKWSNKLKQPIQQQAAQ